MRPASPKRNSDILLVVMSDLVRKIESLLETLRRDPMKQGDVRDAIQSLVVESGDPRTIRVRIVADLDATEDEAYWGALDAVLERVPPAPDWILERDVYRPGEASVRERALAVGALIQQYEYERLIREAREDADRDDARTDDEIVPPDLVREARRHRWLVLARLGDVLGREERDAIETEPGAWTDAQCADASWRSEAFGVLAWSLGLLATIPRYDDSFDDEELLDVYEELLEGTAVTALRNWDELARASKRAEEWHARSKETPSGNRRALARASRPDPLDSEPVEGDMCLWGKPYFRLDNDEMDLARSIAYQRHYASVWLLGGHFGWDDVPTHDAAALVN